MSGLFGSRTQQGYTAKVPASAAGSFSVPAGFYIDQVVVKETANHAITGGLKFGTTNGGTDVIIALAVGALGLVKVTDAALLKSIFSLTANQTIYFDAVSSWNSAVVDVYIVLKKLG